MTLLIFYFAFILSCFGVMNEMIH